MTCLYDPLIIITIGYSVTVAGVTGSGTNF